MISKKPILALSSLGLGVAMLLVALQIQRDRLAFTSQLPRNSDAVTDLSFVVPISAPATPDPTALAEEGSVEVQVLAPLRQQTLVPKLRNPPAATESVEPSQPPCKPEWRVLESGPAGKRVREIC